MVEEDRIARQIADRRNARKRNALAARSRKRISLEDLDAALKETSTGELGESCAAILLMPLTTAAVISSGSCSLQAAR